MNDCLFCKIIAKEIPSTGVYEDADVYAFLDIKPVNPGHTLVVPKKHSDGLHDASPEVLKAVIVSSQKIAKALVASGICEAFNIEANNGAIAGQVIPHLHFHVIPRRTDDGLKHWPGHEQSAEQATEISRKISQTIT